jgi:hypothetical protein
MLITSLAVFMLSTGPAFASGKGSGAGTPPPDPTPVADPCEGYWNLPAYADGTTPLVNRTNGGFVVVHAWLSGALTLDFVVAVPGWTYTVENGGGTKGRVQISFENPTTGQTASIRVEPGKTDIR